MVPLPELSAAGEAEPTDGIDPDRNEVDAEAAAVVGFVITTSVQAKRARYQSLFILVPAAPGTSAVKT